MIPKLATATQAIMQDVLSANAPADASADTSADEPARVEEIAEPPAATAEPEAEASNGSGETVAKRKVTVNPASLFKKKKAVTE